MPMATRVLEHVIISKVLAGEANVALVGKAGHYVLLITGILSLAGLGLVIYASYLWFLRMYAPELAVLYAGLISLFLSCAIVGAFFLYLHHKQKRIRKIKKEVMNTVENALRSLDDSMGDPVRENPKTAVLLASLAGYVVGDRVM